MVFVGDEFRLSENASTGSSRTPTSQGSRVGGGLLDVPKGTNISAAPVPRDIAQEIRKLLEDVRGIAVCFLSKEQI